MCTLCAFVINLHPHIFVECCVWESLWDVKSLDTKTRVPTDFSNLELTKLWLFCGDGGGWERSKNFGVQKKCSKTFFEVDRIVEETSDKEAKSAPRIQCLQRRLFSLHLSLPHLLHRVLHPLQKFPQLNQSLIKKNMIWNVQKMP